MTGVYHDLGDFAQVKSWRETLDQAITFVDPKSLDSHGYGLFLKSTVVSRIQDAAAGAA